jgi:tape measure domain-containing protein
MDFIAGDVVARLRADLTGFTQSLAAAQQQLQQFAQQAAQLRTQQQGQQQSTTQLYDAYGRLTRGLRETVTATRAAQDGIRQVRDEQDRARDAAERWRRVLEIGAGVGLATGLTAIVSQLVRLGRSLIDTGVQMEQLRASITAISGSASTGAAQFQFLVDTGNRLGFSLTTLAEGFRQISGATRGTVLAGQETQKIFDAVATSARAMGASQQQLERALLAIGQVISKGTVQMEELRGQLAEAIPGAVQIAARAFGVTTEELNKMVASGTVGAIPFVRALTRQMQYELAPAAREAAQTTGAAFARLGNEIMLAAEAIANSGILQALRTISTAAAETLRIIRETLGAGAASREQVRDIFQQEALLGTGLKPGEVGGPQLARLGQIQQRIDDLRRSLQGWARLIEQNPQLVNDEQLAKQRQELATLEAEKLAYIQTYQTAKQVTAERNKQMTDQDRVNTATEQGRKILEQYRRDLQALRQDAERLPGAVGRPGGSAEEQQRFQREALQLQEKAAEQLRGILRQAPQMTPELAGWAKELNVDLTTTRTKLEEAQKAQRDLTSEARRSASEFQRQTEAAAAQASTLQATLARARTFIARPDQTAAEEARARVEQQFAQIKSQLERGILELERSMPLQGRVPTLLQEYRDALSALEQMVTREGDIAYNEVIEREFLTPLRKLAAQYQTTKEVRDADTASTLAATLATTQYAEESAKLLKIIQDSAAVEQQVPTLQRQAASSAANLAQIQQARQTLQELQTTLYRTQMQGFVPSFFGEKASRVPQLPEPRIDLTEEQLRQRTEQMKEQIRAQEQLNTFTRPFVQLGTTVADTWVTGLTNIVMQTQNVSAAFKEMGRQILDTMARVLLNEGIRQLFGLGVRLLGGAFGGTASGASSLGGSGFEIVMAQHGGVVTRPTIAVLGENRATSPEYIFNRPQMQAIMQGMQHGERQGGQGHGEQGITIINVASRQQAEQEAKAQQAMGRRTIINEVLQELSAGSSSRIARAVRMAQ